MESKELICVVEKCGKAIVVGETYYLLGGGKVVNCEDCACNNQFTIVVNGKSVTMTRGWDKTAVADKIKRVLY